MTCSTWTRLGAQSTRCAGVSARPDNRRGLSDGRRLPLPIGGDGGDGGREVTGGGTPFAAPSLPSQPVDVVVEVDLHGVPLRLQVALEHRGPLVLDVGLEVTPAGQRVFTQ